MNTVDDRGALKGVQHSEASYVIRPWVGLYFFCVALNHEAAGTLLARMDASARVQAEGLHHLEFDRAGYAAKWLNRSDLPPHALALFDADDRLRLIRASVPAGCGGFSKHSRELIAPGHVGWSEWWSDGNSAEYAESNGLPRAELERVSRLEFSSEPLFPEASW